MPGGDKNIKPSDNPKPFNSPEGRKNINRNGRPPRLVSHINKELKESGFEVCKVSDIGDAYLTLINLPLSKILDIANKNNDDYPMLYKLVAKELTGKRGMEMLEKLLDRSIGKPKQSIDHTTNDKEIDMAPRIFSIDEIAKRMKDI